MESPTSASPTISAWSSRGPSSSAVVLLFAPVPTRLKEWAYAGFAITLGSAIIAHFSVGDGPEASARRQAPAYSGALVFLLAPRVAFARAQRAH